MPRGRDVTTEDMSNDYLADLAGDQVVDQTDVNDDASDDKGSAQQQTQIADQQVDKGARQQRQDDTGQQQRGSRQQQKADPAAQKTNKADNRQQADTGKINLNDAKTREVYHALKERMQPVFLAQDRKINEATRRNEQLEAQLAVYKERDQVAQQYKLTPIQQVQGMQLMAAYMKDPAATVKLLIDKAQANGHNIQIGQQASGVSAEAIKDMIAQQVAPLTREAEHRAALQERRVEAQQQLEAFYAEFPDAQVHEATLNAALQRNPGMSLHRALSTLKDYYYQNGLDWSVPLNEHLAQRSQQQQQTPQRQTKPMQLRGGNGAQFDQQDRQAGKDAQAAPASTRYRDIVKQVMAANGLDTSNL